MKKYILVLLALTLVLCAGCGKQDPVQTEAPTTAPVQTEEPTTAPVETTVPPTTEATIPEPELGVAYARVDSTPAVLTTLMRDDVVDVVGEYDADHYVVKTDLGYGLVKKEMLRMEGAAPYEVWTGYAYYNAEVYTNFYLSGEPVQKLYENANVNVLDELKYCYVVQVENLVGFMDKKDLTRWPISSDSTGADGGDISLQNQGGIFHLAAIEQKGDVTGQAVVLADGTEVILAYFDRGEEIPVVAEEGFAETRDGYVTVYLDGLYAYVPQMLVLPEGEAVYEAWLGYGRWNSAIFDNYYLLGEPAVKLYVNAQIQVIDELETCYLVEVDGVTGYISKDLVSATRIDTSGNSDSEWSPPAL